MASCLVRRTKIFLLRALPRVAKSPYSISSASSSIHRSLLVSFSSSLCNRLEDSEIPPRLNLLVPSRCFCSRSSHLDDASEGPTAVDYRLLLQEDEYCRLADTTINYLLEKLEEYGESVDIPDFDIDYGNDVLTLKVGNLGTYVLNKQTPNRQIWLSSPASGPSRFDWDPKAQAWIYRRTKANLYRVLENELEQLCGLPITLFS